MGKKVQCVSWNDEIHDKIAKQAEKEKRNFSNMTEKMCEYYLENLPDARKDK